MAPPLDSSNGSSSEEEEESEDTSEEEEEKKEGEEVDEVKCVKTDRDVLRNILLNTLYYYNCKEKVDATMSKLKGEAKVEDAKKGDKDNDGQLPK